MKKIGLIILLNAAWLFTSASGCFTTTLTPLQMAAADLHKVRAYYNANPLMTVDTYYMAFDEHSAKAPKEARYGSYIKNKAGYYTKILQLETICCSDMIINVDNEDKVIAIGDNDNSDLDPFSGSFDSLLVMGPGVSLKNISPSERMYTLNFEAAEFSEYDKMELWIDVKNNRFTRIVLYYGTTINISGDYYADGKKPRLEIHYKNYRNSVANLKVLDKTSYVQETNGKITGIGKLKNYSILDQRKKTRLKGYKK